MRKFICKYPSVANTGKSGAIYMPAKKDWLNTVVGMLMLALTVLPSEAKRLPRSVAEAKKAGVLIRPVSITPRSFLWEGHQVEVLESWLEQPKEVTLRENSAHLVFRLQVDSSELKESDVSRDKIIKFRRQDSVEAPYAESTFSYAPRKGLRRALPGGAYGTLTHNITIRQPLPKEIQLQVETFLPLPGKVDKPVTTPTATVLTVHLSDQKAD